MNEYNGLNVVCFKVRRGEFLEKVINNAYGKRIVAGLSRLLSYLQIITGTF